MEINITAFLEVLPKIGIAFLGVFIVTIVIVLFVVITNMIFKSKSN